MRKPCSKVLKDGAIWKDIDVKEKEVLSNEQPLLESINRKTKDGIEQTILLSIYPWQDKQGSLTGVWGFLLVR